MTVLFIFAVFFFSALAVGVIQVLAGQAKIASTSTSWSYKVKHAADYSDGAESSREEHSGVNGARSRGSSEPSGNSGRAESSSEEHEGPVGRGNQTGSYRGDYLVLARSPYEVLQVRPGASEEEITAAYRRLVQLYHPDKVADLAPEFTELAERRTKEINTARAQLKSLAEIIRRLKSRGLSGQP